MQFLAHERRGLGVISGAGGLGKTLVLRSFARQARTRGQVPCYVNLLGLEPRSFCWSLAATLGTGPRTSDDVFTLWRSIADRLRENHLLGTPTVLLLDDADQAAHDVLMQVLRLVKSAAGTVTTVLAVENSRISRLGGDLLQLADLHIGLDPWDEHDVGQYVRSALRQAGCTRAVFSDSAISRLQILTDGVPRWVAQLADLALVAGAGQQSPAIDEDTVDSVFPELAIARGQLVVAGQR